MNPADPLPPAHPLPASTLTDPAAALAAAGVIAPPRSPGQLGCVGRCELLRLLGAGGMGTVFLARDSESGQRVAVKFLRAEWLGDNQAAHRFLKEAEHLRQLSHPNLVPVLEVGAQAAGPYFVMPFFERGSLARRLVPGTALGTEEALGIAVQAAEAIQFAHRRGIIHRDIKPGNILFNEAGVACVGDFGLARSLFNDSVLDVNGSHCEGTAPYMSPQVAAGEAEDTRCDLYSLGAVLYELLTGRPPHTGSSPAEVRRQVLAGPPPAITTLNPAADARLAFVAATAMAREHRDRYANAGDLLADLRRVEAGHEPFGAHGPTRALRQTRSVLQRWSKPAWVALAGLLVCATLLTFLRLQRTGSLPEPTPRGGMNPAGGIQSGPPDEPGSLGRSNATGSARVEAMHEPTLLSGVIVDRFTVTAHFASPHVTRWQGTLAADRDRIAGKELVVTSGNKLLEFYGQGGLRTEWMADWPADALGLGLVRDLDGDGVDEVFVDYVSEQTNLHVVLLNNWPQALHRFHAGGAGPDKRGRNRGPSSSLGARLVVSDGNATAREVRVLARLVTCYSDTNQVPWPRGLCCFDLGTSDLTWTYRFGPAVGHVVALDLDEDGRKDFLVGSQAVDNGNVGPDGTSDRNGYLFAISSQGRCLWARELSGPSSTVTPLLADVDGDGVEDPLAWIQSHHETSHTNAIQPEARILRLNQHGARLSTFDAEACLWDCVASDLDADGKAELLTTDCRGTLRMLDAQSDGSFRRRREVKFTEQPSPIKNSPLQAQARVIGVGRFLPHAGQQVAVRSFIRHRSSKYNPGLASEEAETLQWERARVTVFDVQLNHLAHFEVQEPLRGDDPFAWLAADVDGDGVLELLWLKEDVTIFKVQAGQGAKEPSKGED